MTTNDDSRPTVGIHTGPPPMIGGDPVIVTDERITDAPVRPCRGCGNRDHHKVACPIRGAGTQIREDQRAPDHPDYITPNDGQLADYMRRWQAKGVTGEMVQWVATKVWDDLPKVTVPDNPRIERERDRLLSEAAKIVSGDREDAYGSARDGFTRTGKMWAAMLGLDSITAEQVAMLLAALKISRLCNDSGHRDSWLDGIGYLALGGDIAKDTADEIAAFRVTD